MSNEDQHDEFVFTMPSNRSQRKKRRKATPRSKIERKIDVTRPCPWHTVQREKITHNSPTGRVPRSNTSTTMEESSAAARSLFIGAKVLALSPESNTYYPAEITCAPPRGLISVRLCNEKHSRNMVLDNIVTKDDEEFHTVKLGDIRAIANERLQEISSLAQLKKDMVANDDFFGNYSSIAQAESSRRWKEFRKGQVERSRLLKNNLIMIHFNELEKKHIKDHVMSTMRDCPYQKDSAESVMFVEDVIIPDFMIRLISKKMTCSIDEAEKYALKYTENYEKHMWFMRLIRSRMNW